MGWTIGVLGFDSRRGLGIFLFTIASRTALGPTQPPIQCVPGALSLGVKRLRCEADHSPPSSAEVKGWVELYLHSPNTPPWRGAQLKHRDNFSHCWGVLVYNTRVMLAVLVFQIAIRLQNLTLEMISESIEIKLSPIISNSYVSLVFPTLPTPRWLLAAHVRIPT
jgi:hypothetical protein